MKFFNWSDEDFTYPYAGIPYTFRAGETVKEMLVSGSSRLLLQQGHLEHFAKHLADREMRKAKVNPGRLDIKEEYMSRCFNAPEVIEDKGEPVVESYVEPAEKKVEEEVKPSSDHVCDECGKEAKSKAGLAAHKRSHKKEVKEEII